MEFKEITAKSVTELQKDLATAREELNSLTVKNRLGQSKTTHQLRQLRRDIAQLLTALRLKI